MQILRVYPILFSFLFSFSFTQAQKDTTLQENTYRVWVKTTEPANSKGGILWSAGDSVVYSTRSYKPGIQLDKLKIESTPVRDIDHILVRKKGNVGKGIAIGGMAGLVCGLLVQLYVLPKDQTTSQMAVFPVLIAGVGVGIGAGLGSVKIRIPIGGKKEVYDLQRQELRRYTRKKE